MKSARLCRVTKRFLSTVPEVYAESFKTNFRTQEDNPVNHNSDHVSLYYKIPNETAQSLFFMEDFQNRISYKSKHLMKPV